MTIITQDRALRSHYEVIVVGAGIGGLVTSSLLAKRGVDVLLVDQHCLPGGACTSFRREGRIYDAGAALIFGFGTKGYNIHSMLMNHLEESIRVIPRDKFFRLDLAGRQLTVWKDLPKFVAELENSFQYEKAEVKNLNAFLVKLYSKYIEGKDLLTPPSELTRGDKLKMVLSSPRRVARLTKLLKQSAYELMSPYITSKTLLEFYDKLCASYAYVTMKETPALMAMTMFTDNHSGGTYYVAGSAQVYSNTLERSIERNGGTVLYDTKVDKIVFDGERACGVQFVDGTVIKADRIVSDTTVWNLCHDLLPKEKVNDKQIAWANSLVPTYPAMVLYAAVDRTVFPAGTNPVEYYVSNPEEIDMGDITLYIPTLTDESLGPPNEHVVTVFSPAPNQDWPRPFEADYQSADYVKRKEKQADLILKEIERRIPNFRRGIKKLYIATPSTIERYTLKTHGCVGGPKQMIGQELMKRLHAKTDWPGLYACGDSTTMGMGTPAVAASGFGAANVILHELGKPGFHRKQFKKQFVEYINHNPSVPTPDRIDDDPTKAMLIAHDCQHCEKQPCKEACPAGIDVAGFVRRIEAANFEGAARLIHETNPFGEVCGYLCPSEALCESACVRKSFASRPVQIRELHRWVSGYAGAKGWTSKREPSNGKTVCVIGAGPAGLSCAHFLARIGYTVDLYDSSLTCGGYLSEFVENGTLPKDSFDRELASIMLPGVRFHSRKSVSTESELDTLRQKYDAVFLTVRLNVKIARNGSVMAMPNVLLGGRAYAESPDSYQIVHAVSEGRKAAIAIHTLVSKGVADEAR